MRRTQHRRASIFIAFAAATALAAAAQSSPAADGAGKALAVQPEFVYAAPDFSFEFDPHHAYSATEAQVFTAIHEGLYVYDPATLEPLPAIAESVDRSKDKKVYTFRLRANARFSNGDPIRAQDVRASWMRMLDPAEEAEYSSLFDLIKGAQDFRMGTQKDPSKVGLKAVSDSVLEVTLESPASYFLKVLCHHSFSVLHSRALKRGAWDADKGLPVSGPFSIALASAAEIGLVKSPYYWDAASVKLPSIKVIFSDKDEEMTARYNSGEIHWLDGSLATLNVMDRGSFQVTEPIFATSYLYFLCDQKPWNDERVRQALLLLLPWDQLRTTERYRVPADTLVIPLQGYPGADVTMGQDKAKALELLKKAGYKSFEALPPLTVKLSDGEDHKIVAKILSDAWTAAGVKVANEPAPGNLYMENLKKGGYAIASMTWIGDFADPLTFLQMWTSGSNLNDARLKNPAYDKLITRSMGEEGSTRMKTLAAAEKLLLESGACIPIYHSTSVSIISTDSIAGWSMNPLDMHPFKFIYFQASTPIEGMVKAY
jgi:peptide/nickel transport system substrate-binding protein/oligopeptide transport system substrate-binding protein